MQIDVSKFLQGERIGGLRLRFFAGHLNIWGDFFEPMKDPLLFLTAHQDEIMQTVSWSNGADFAPEFLMEILIKQHQQAA